MLCRISFSLYRSIIQYSLFRNLKQTLKEVHDDILILTFHFKSVVSDSQWYILKLFLAIPSNWTIWTIGCFLLNFLFCSNISLNRCKLHAGLKSSNHILKSYICFSHTYAQNKSRVAIRGHKVVLVITQKGIEYDFLISISL